MIKGRREQIVFSLVEVKFFKAQSSSKRKVLLVNAVNDDLFFFANYNFHVKLVAVNNSQLKI